jgi:hypothetical protein
MNLSLVIILIFLVISFLNLIISIRGRESRLQIIFLSCLSIILVIVELILLC